MAENVSPCSAEMVPVQIMSERGPDDVTSLSGARLRDYPRGFSSFVTTVTEHLATKLDQEKLCLDSAESRRQSLLQFVPLPISYWPPPPPALSPSPPFDVSPSSVCRISSPWIELVIEREPVPSVRGFIRYSERQLVADQAMLEGALVVPPGIATPIDSSEFLEYAGKYDFYDFTVPGKPKTNLVEEHVPPDLIWLFRRSSGGCWGMPGDFMEKAMELGAEGYTKVVTTMIDRCFESDVADIHYNSILDIDDTALLEQYKIVTSDR
ncbi:hypothetical protein LJB99_05195 [Deltaproteobacteria bacterium OttesenSCG-928-K17]|nr:hypothetical protein [Deltaproteobacteria bacterium OttesenSCG-928-K17]